MNNRRLGIVLSYVNTFLNMAVGLFLSSFLLRMLGDSEYGVYQTIASFSNYLVLLEFGTGAVMTRNLSVCRGKNESQEQINKNAATIWTETNFLGILILIISVVFYCLLDAVYANSLTADQIQYGKKIFIFTTLYLVFSFYAQTLSGIALAFEHYSFQSIMSIVRQIFRVVLLICLILCFRYALVIAIIDFSISICQYIFTYIYCKRNFGIKFSMKYFDGQILKSSLPLSAAIFVQALTNQANNNVDKFLIGIKINPEAVALYSVAMYIFQMFNSIGTVPLLLYTPQIAKNISSGLEGKELVDSLIPPCRLVAIIGGAILFGFIAIGRQFISIVYGTQYLQAWVIAIIVSVPTMILLTNGVMLSVLNVKNLTKPRTTALIITTIVNVILTFIWINIWGMIGAAIATALSTLLCQATLLNIYYSKRLNMNMIYLFGKAYKGILIYQIIGTMAGFAIAWLIPNTVLAFLLGGISFVSIFACGFFLFGATTQEKRQLSNILHRIITVFKK